MAAVISFKFCRVLIWKCMTSIAWGDVERAASASSMVAFQTATESGGAASVKEWKDWRASATFSTARRCLRITAFTAPNQFALFIILEKYLTNMLHLFPIVIIHMVVQNLRPVGQGSRPCCRAHRVQNRP